MKKLFTIIVIYISLPASAQHTTRNNLYIYGGQGHDIFLGCLNCDDRDSKSIWNEYGAHGSTYSVRIIYKHYDEIRANVSQWYNKIFTKTGVISPVA